MAASRSTYAPFVSRGLLVSHDLLVSRGLLVSHNLLASHDLLVSHNLLAMPQVNMQTHVQMLAHS